MKLGKVMQLGACLHAAQHLQLTGIVSSCCLYQCRELSATAQWSSCALAQVALLMILLWMAAAKRPLGPLWNPSRWDGSMPEGH